MKAMDDVELRAALKKIETLSASPDLQPHHRSQLIEAASGLQWVLSGLSPEQRLAYAQQYDQGKPSPRM